MELLMIYKISPSPLCQRGGKKGKTFLKKEREKAEMPHSITRRAIKIFTSETAEDGEAIIQKVGVCTSAVIKAIRNLECQNEK